MMIYLQIYLQGKCTVTENRDVRDKRTLRPNHPKDEKSLNQGDNKRGQAPLNTDKRLKTRG